MHIIYVDESGTPDVEPGSFHFVVAGVSMPLALWKERDAALRSLLRSARIPDAEVHAAWMARLYPEQQRLTGFEALNDAARRQAVIVERKKDLAKASLKGEKAVKGLKTNYKKTDAYIHLTHAERMAVLRAIADAVAGWEDVVLFADAHKKDALSSDQRSRSREYALEQVTSRYNKYLNRTTGPSAIAVMVHDQHQAESLNLTALFRRWHREGTTFTKIPHIAETPLFVDSSLTAMVQVADLAAYGTRRFFDKEEGDLFDRIYPRFDRLGAKLVGLRHYTAKTACTCRVCVDHGRTVVSPPIAGGAAV